MNRGSIGNMVGTPGGKKKATSKKKPKTKTKGKGIKSSYKKGGKVKRGKGKRC